MMVYIFDNEQIMLELQQEVSCKNPCMKPCLK